MRSTGFLGKLLIACLAAVAIVAGCKTTTAGGNASGGGGADGGTSRDGGMMGSMAGAASGAMSAVADAGAAAASDIKQGAQAAGQAASSAASTAADAARNAAGSITDGGTAAASDAGAAASAPSMTDAQIAAVAVAANQVDIDAGKLAKKTSKNAKVKAFASDMIRDHTSANKQAAALVKKLGVTPEENDTSRSLKQGGDDNLARLKALKGKEFDKAYAEHEAAYHQAVLDALDNTLIPNAQNADLKSLLQSVRGVVAQHLDHAKMMVDSLSK